MSPLLMGNSKTTSLPVSFLYTDPNVSSLYSVEFLSLGSKYTCRQRKTLVLDSQTCSCARA